MITIIAEAGVNHNGDMDMACALIDAAARAGADIVKFQTFNAEALASHTAPKAEYQKQTTGTQQSQLEMLRALQISPQNHHRLLEQCHKRGITFLSTPFDFQSLDFLTDELGLDMLKIGSGDLTNAPLIHASARKGLPMILSTGMSDLAGIEVALGVIAHGYLNRDDPGAAAFGAAYASDEGRALIAKNITLLHCTTAYPAPAHAINLRAMDAMGAAFCLPVGYSDHSDGIAVSIAAAARGAAVIEKHITLDRALPGPDHRTSLEPDAFLTMVEAIRTIEVALGTDTKQITDAERGNMSAARKSLVAARAIAQGELFTHNNLTTKRPGNGMSPLLFWEILGRKAGRAYAANELIGEV